MIVCGVSIERNATMIQVAGNESIARAMEDALTIAAQIAPSMMHFMVQPLLRPFGMRTIILTRL